jgi:hypothetical protein
MRRSIAQNTRILLLLIFMLSLLFPAVAQKKKKDKKEEGKPAEITVTAPEKKDEKKEQIQPYDKVITAKAKTDDGLFKVHKVEDKYYFEIPDSLLGREILSVTRISKTATGIGSGGEELNSQVLRFQKKDKKILLRSVSYNNVATDSLPIAQSVRNSNFEPILVAFDIKAYSKDSSAVIDVANLMLKDVPAFGLDEVRRKTFKVSTLDETRTYVESIKSFPINIEARNVVTYKASEPPSNPQAATISLEINNSIVLLPKKPMKARLRDKRVGYFSISQVDYGRDEHKADIRSYITRWKLEPKDEAAYLRGELVEPKKPIIFYIDPATPKKWRSYLKLGVEDWNVAFEKAGFKNAVQAKDAPTFSEDPEWSAEDARFSVIRYFASNIENAYGPQVTDPRSGEVIESHIGWYHNVMKLLRNWYFVQTAAINPDARKVKFSDEVMGKLIRFVSAHEVGHTLGLPHNMGASHAYPVDSLRSASFTKRNGICPSIMDYARFNYVAQPEDKNVSLMPGIGEYDKYAIMWGYSYLPEAKTPDAESITLNKWVVDRADNPIYFYGRQTFNPIDPRSQAEDLGDNATKASRYGIANLKRIVPNLIAWTTEKGKDYDNLEELYNQIALQWNRYNGHVRANVGGVYETFKTYEQAGEIFVPVPKNLQKEAITFLLKETFTTPTWLLDQNILRRIENAGAIERIRNYQSGNVNALLDFSRLARLIEAEAMLGNKTYTILDLFTDLRGGLWSELATGKTIDVYRRNLQRAHIERLEGLLHEEQVAVANSQRALTGFTTVNVNESDIRAVARAELRILKVKISQAAVITNDPLSKYHLEDCVQRINDILEPKK